MDLKIGDKIRIIARHKVVGFTSGYTLFMFAYGDCETYITKIAGKRHYLNIDQERYFWRDNWLEKVED